VKETEFTLATVTSVTITTHTGNPYYGFQ